MPFILRTYLSYNWKLYPLTNISPLPPPGRPQPLGTTVQLCFYDSVFYNPTHKRHRTHSSPSVCLISCSTVHARPTPVSQTAGFASFSGLTDIPVYRRAACSLSIHPCLHVVAIQHGAQVSLPGPVSISSGCTPRMGFHVPRTVLF